MSYFVATDKDQALKDFVVYSDPNEDFDDIFGLLGKYPNEIHQALGRSKFEKKVTPVPEYFERKTVSPEWISSFYLNKYIPKETIQKLKKKGVPREKWVNSHRHLWITMKDILNLPPNEPVKLLSLHRNILDETDIMEDAKIYKPSTFFKNSYVTIWRSNDFDLDCKILFPFQEEQNLEPVDFEFDVEWQKNYWFPLRNGVYDNDEIDPELNQIKHWSDFSTNTHVGWRGPMIFWDDIDSLPKIFKV